MLQKILSCKGCDSIDPDSHLVHDLGLTSFEVMVLLCDIEETFRVVVEVNEIPKTLTFSNLATFLEERTSLVDTD